MDYITLLNLIFSIVIFILGLKKFMETSVKAFLFVGLGFFCYGISHVTVLLGMAADIKTILAFVRAAGYILVIIGLVV
jgi:hypothetical protein